MNGACPTQATPSPPIWLKVLVLRSIHTDMKWQPMPAMAREPSGTRVLVLCGQPLQNQGARSPVSVFSSVSAFSRCATTARRASMRAATSLPSGARPSFFNRLAIALAMIAGVRSALARSSQLSLGLGIDHSPPEMSPSGSSNLPSTLGRTSERQL